MDCKPTANCIDKGIPELSNRSLTTFAQWQRFYSQKNHLLPVRTSRTFTNTSENNSPIISAPWSQLFVLHQLQIINNRKRNLQRTFSDIFTSKSPNCSPAIFHIAYRYQNSKIQPFEYNNFHTALTPCMIK